jgi:hypothetical protein
MDYIVENTEYSKEQQLYRLQAYTKQLSDIMNKTTTAQQVKFWEKESQIEQKIYKKMKVWERRHPIIAIVICTILGGILTSLVAGIILEAIK